MKDTFSCARKRGEKIGKYEKGEIRVRAPNSCPVNMSVLLLTLVSKKVTTNEIEYANLDSNEIDAFIESVSTFSVRLAIVIDK